MARNFNGGTDHIYYTIPDTEPNAGCFAFWMRTTQATTNTGIASDWTATSRNGWGLIINNVANKITAQGYTTTTNVLNIASATSINDGNPHHIAFNFSRQGAVTSQIYVDGVQDASGASSNNWTRGSGNFFIQLGLQGGGFWAPFVGDLWEVGYWLGSKLSAAEIAALAKDFAPPRVRQHDLWFYAPLVRDTRCLTSKGVQNAISGTTLIDHPTRIIGGLV